MSLSLANDGARVPRPCPKEIAGSTGIAILSLDFDGTQASKNLTEAQLWSQIGTFGGEVSSSLGSLREVGLYPITCVVTARTLPEALRISSGHIVTSGDASINSCAAVVGENGAVAAFLGLDTSQEQALKTKYPHLILETEGLAQEESALSGPNLLILKTAADVHGAEFLDDRIVKPVISKYPEAGFAWSYRADKDDSHFNLLGEMSGHPDTDATRRSIQRYATGYLKVDTRGQSGDAFIAEIKEKCSREGVVVREDCPLGASIVTLEFEGGPDKGQAIRFIDEVFKCLYPGQFLLHMAFGDKDNDGPMLRAAKDLGGYGILVNSPWRQDGEGQSFVKECYDSGIIIADKPDRQGVIEGITIVHQRLMARDLADAFIPEPALTDAD